MTKISNKSAYQKDVMITDNDYLVGTNGDTNKKETKSYQISDLRNYLIQGLTPIDGGTIKITQIVYTGILNTPEEVANQLNPTQIILSYEVVVISVNGDKYILNVQNTTIGQGQTPLLNINFIPINLVANNLATGISTYKGLNVTTGREEHYSLGSESFSITKEVKLGLETGIILLEQIPQTNLGNGIEVYKGLNSASKKQEFYTLGSAGSIKIKKEVILGVETGRILIDLPNVGSVSKLIVNNSAIPSYDEWVLAGGNLISNPTFEYKGFGTEASPYTDTIVYNTESTYTITPDTAIQNANDAYVDVGTGGTRLEPKKSGQKIKVQENLNGGYNYAGDFNYSNYYLEFEENINCTTSGYLVDMDNSSYFNATNAVLTLSQLKAGKKIQSAGLGYRNSGNSVSTTTYATGRILNILGEDTCIYSALNDITKYLINADETNTLGNNNDGNLSFYITGGIRADYQGIYKVGGRSNIDIYNILTSGTLTNAVNVNLKAFVVNGGQVRHFGKAKYVFENTNTRNDLIQLNPTALFTPYFIANGVTFSGSCINLINKTSNESASVQVNESVSPYGLIVTNIFETPITTPKWSPEFRNNNFQTGLLDLTKVDITAQNIRSSSNIIGNNIIESLRVFNSKEQARATLLPSKSAFIKSNLFNAVDLVQGVEYKIITSGSPSLGAVGTYITATGSETGTGTASLETREILS